MTPTEKPGWLQRRPWLLVPGLALLPLTAALMHHFQPPPRVSPTPQTPSPTPTSGLPGSGRPIGDQPLPPVPAIPTPPKPSQRSPRPQKRQIAKGQPGTSQAGIDGIVELQVAIALGIDATTIGSSQGATLLDNQGQVLQQLNPGQTHSIQPTGDRITLNARSAPEFVIVKPVPGGHLFLGDRPYRGRFLLAAQNSRLWVVNYIDLRHYLHSVVASEVSPSWPIAALKAQAVAARSYALTYYFRRANPLYHLGSDEYFQVYSGMAKEDDRANQAVNQTTGEFVSHRGGIVESLYAASDDIVAEAFQGKGMSQLGALNLAEQGYDYRRILAHYYPKTKVARIEQDYE